MNVLVADNPWCNSNEELGTVREAVEGIEQLVEYTKVGSPPCNRIRNLGYAGGAFLEVRAHKPYQLIGDSRELRAEITRLYEQKFVEKKAANG